MAERHLRIFVVEDSEWYNRLLVHTLSLNPDHEVRSFLTGKELLVNLHHSPDVVTLDYRLPDMSGLDVLKQIREYSNEIQVILISEQEDIDMVVTLLKHGAYDYITKTDDIRDRLLNTIQNVKNGIGLKRELTTLRKEVQKKYSFRDRITGESKAIREVHELIEKAVSTNITVVLSGETGTGKEVVAKAIHYSSNRKEKPFVAVNIAAIPSELIESELFGHEKGAFTGAASRRTGHFEEANGGTLFLDEIGEMPLNMQAKILRALQEREIQRIGASKTIRIECRIIVATNKNLKEEVRKGNFREDLYYRLMGLTIELPPLRDRGNDVMILARNFLEQFCQDNDLPLKRLSAAACNKLMGYPYPGNVRELKSLVELAATLSDGELIEPGDILVDRGDPLSAIHTDNLTMQEYELRIIRATIKKYNNDIRSAAEHLGIGVSTIYRKLKEAGQEV